jgi:hypothetical protein
MPRRQLRRTRRKRFRRPVLRFSPTAWAKLLFLRDQGPTEVGAFGISAAEDLLLVQEIHAIRQRCTEVTVHFDDAAVADFFEEQVERGLRPEQFGRIWIHTHPGDSADPSCVDVETFRRCFGRCDWAVMFILARGGACHAELRWRHGNALLPMDVEIDYSQAFPESDHELWEQEYLESVQVVEPRWAKQPQEWIFDEAIEPFGLDVDSGKKLPLQEVP